MPTPTVLLVDDDDHLLNALARTLRHQPYVLLTVRSGSEAIWVLKRRDVDVIVSDEQMPGVSGIDLLTWTAEHLPDVVRIMLTGHADTTVAIRAINDAAIYRFFTKPCDHVQLAIAIRKGIEHRAAQAEFRRLAEAAHG